MAAMSIAAAFLVLVLFISLGGPLRFFKLLREEFRRPASRTYFIISAVLAGACGVSLVAAHFYPLSYGAGSVKINFLGDMAKCWYLFWPLLIGVGLRVCLQDQQNKILQIWLGTFILLSLLGVFQHFTGWPRPQMIPGHEPYYHVTLFLGHHLSVANILIFPFFACLDLATSKKFTKETLFPQWMLWTGVLLGATTLFLTYSRMLWIALPIGIFIFIFWNFQRRVSIAATLLLLTGMFVVFQSPAVQNRMKQSMGIGSRYDLWGANFEFFKTRPLTGAGWHHNLELAGYYLKEKLQTNDVFVGHAHNNILEMLGGTGMIGLAAWILWCGMVFIFLIKLLRAGQGAHLFTKGLVCAWIVFHLNGITQVNFWESKVLHQMTFIMGWILYWLGNSKPVFSFGVKK